MDLKRGGRILIVEDEALLRTVMAAELREAGYHVDEAATGVSALVALSQSFDLLLTDIRMAGGVNGWDLAEAARRSQPHIEVIYMTGYAGEPERRVERSLLMRKPFTVSEMLTLMSQSSASDETP